MSSETSNQNSSGIIPLHVPEIGGNEWNYLKDCLDTAWVSSVGAYVDRFETAVARRAGREYGIATTTGTAALHTALMVAGIGEGDEVLVPAMTFIASANAVRYTRARPVFLDVDPVTWQLDPEILNGFLKSCARDGSGAVINKDTGGRVRAIMPVHILGHPADMDPIMELADSYDLIVIEDAAEGMGALYRGNPVGSTGHMACFSFNGNKIITTGGGGMIVTDDQQWAERARHLTTQAKSHPTEYEHDEVGYNYRLTNLQAALGCAQMERLDDYVQRKRDIACRYGELLKGIPGIEPMEEAPWATSTFWMYTVRIGADEYGTDSRTLMKYLAAREIMSRPLWKPMHLVKANMLFLGEPCPVSETLYRECLSIPCSVGLTDDQQNRVVDALLERRGKR